MHALCIEPKCLTWECTNDGGEDHMWVGGTTSQNHLERVGIICQFTSVGITFFETPASVLCSVRLPATTLQ